MGWLRAYFAVFDSTICCADDVDMAADDVDMRADDVDMTPDDMDRTADRRHEVSTAPLNGVLADTGYVLFPVSILSVSCLLRVLVWAIPGANVVVAFSTAVTVIVIAFVLAL